jgi:hypothetical protein
MIKKILVLFLILLPIITAQNITISISKNNYFQYETLQAEVLFNLSLANQITASNFVLVDKENESIPASIFLEEISKDHYFIYFDLPRLDNGTYYFLVKDVKYTDTTLKKISKSKEFYLSNDSSISIFPAIFNKINYTILKITNHANPINLTLKAEEINLSKTLFLNQILNIDFNIPKNIDNFNININYGDRFYSIPVVPYKETPPNLTREEIKPLIVPQPPSDAIIFLNSSFGTYFNNKINLTKDSSPRGYFYIQNLWTYPVKNIQFKLTNDLSQAARLNLSFISQMNPNETLMQCLWINENQNLTKSKYFGNIEIKSEQGTSTFLPLEIIFLEEKTTNISEENTLSFNGTVVNQTKKGIIKEEKKQNKNLIIIILLLVLALFIIFIYFIFKKRKRKQEFDEFIRNIK